MGNTKYVVIDNLKQNNNIWKQISFVLFYSHRNNFTLKKIIGLSERSTIIL